MYILYSFLLTVGILALLPRFIFDALRHGKYVAGFRERVGRLPRIAEVGCPVIWLHCVSVGETQAARPLVQALCERYPSYTLAISTTTLTGQTLAREIFRSSAKAVFYFPFDWSWTVRRALRAIGPSVVLVMETELWPNFLRECHKRGVPVVLVNGRISKRSFAGYKKLGRFIKRVVSDLTLAVMQTDGDAERICALGLTPENVRVSGNLKFDMSVGSNEQALTNQLRERFRFNDERPLVVAASTHAPEERIIIEAFKQLRNAYQSKARLLIAPRHPERFAEVATLVAASGFKWIRRSDASRSDDSDCDIILLDTIGELRAVYPLAALVFVGGSIAPIGGHNLLEPAAAAKCLITGAHTSNFATIARGLVEQDALVQLPALSDREAPLALGNVLQDLLSDDTRRKEIGDHALSMLRRNRGATERTVEMIGPLLKQHLK